jgi:hypothetical protein
MGGVQHVIEPTDCPVVDHPYVSFPLIHAEEVCAANHSPRPDVVQLANLNNLGPDEFVLGGVLVFGLCLQERGAGYSRHEVWLSIPHLPLVPLRPVPEERSGPLQPLKPTSIRTPAHGLVPRFYGG